MKQVWIPETRIVQLKRSKVECNLNKNLNKFTAEKNRGKLTV